MIPTIHSTLLSLVVSSAGGTPFHSQTPPGVQAEQEAVELVMSAFVAARNERDADGAAKHFAPDYDQGDLTTGRIQIRSGAERRRAYERAFQEGRMRNRMEAATTSFRLLADDVALLDAELSFLNDDGGRDIVNFATFVFVLRDDRWMIGAVRMSPQAP